MRRFGLFSVCLLGSLGVGGSPILAQSGFYYGGAYYRESPPREERRRKPSLQPIDSAPPPPAPPLPVPRPRFAPDPAPDAKPSAVETTKPAVIKPVEIKPVETRQNETKPAESKPTETPAPEAPKVQEPVKPRDPGQAPSVPTDPKAAASDGTPLPPAKPEGLKPSDADKPPATPVSPAVAPSGANTAFTPRSPDSDSLCPGRLKDRHVAAEAVEIGRQIDERCTVVQAVKLTALTLPDGATVTFPDQPTIACTTADVFSTYVRDLLTPLAKGSFGTPVSAVWTGPGLECRSRDHVFGAKLSAHGQGLAIDIARLKLADGRSIEVGEPKTDGDTAFEGAARAAACGYFHTVLGPGSDTYHRTHWHFDLEVRGAKGDTKYCH